MKTLTKKYRVVWISDQIIEEIEDLNNKSVTYTNQESFEFDNKKDIEKKIKDKKLKPKKVNIGGRQ